MPKRYSSIEVIDVLEKEGYVRISQKGSHVKFFSHEKKCAVIVPANKKDIPIGTFLSIVRQAKMSKKDFE